jgi:nucleoside-diphosphate-sugar epimerase
MGFNFAASVGGIRFVQGNTAEALENVLINTNLARECAQAGVQRYFFASSSCVYPGCLETPLRETDAMPADPMGGYGWEKLFSERLCQAFAAERNLPCTILRYHGIYGPGDVRPAGRDHVATAIAKKVIHAKLSGVHEISIWGDGEQQRSFLYVDDCVEGTYRAMSRGITGPMNLAHPEPMTVNELVSHFEEIAGVKLTRFYNAEAHRGRHVKVSDNSLLRKHLNWEPETPHRDGLRALYNELWDRAIAQH